MRSAHRSSVTVEEVIAMTTIAAERERVGEGEASLRWGSWLMGIAAAGFIGYAVIFFVLNFSRLLEIGIGKAEVDVSKAEIQAFSPSLYEYISHLQVALSGAIAAIGVAVVLLVAYGVRRGLLWAWAAAVTTPVLFLLVALPMHYANHFDTLGHLGLIYLAVLIFVAGALIALRGILADRS
jgi:hypothetical protein